MICSEMKLRGERYSSDIVQIDHFKIHPNVVAILESLPLFTYLENFPID